MFVAAVLLSICSCSGYALVLVTAAVELVSDKLA